MNTNEILAFIAAYTMCTVLIVVIAIIIQVFIAKRMEYVARLKGYDKTAKVFWMVFLFNIIGIIYTLALPDLNKRKILEKIASAAQATGSNSFSAAKKYDDLPKI